MSTSIASIVGAIFCAAFAAAGLTALGARQGPSQPPAQGKGSGTGPSAESIERANQVLTEARKALGGEKLAAIKNLVAAGRTRRVRGDNLVPIEFEIFIELPNKYVRVDEFPAEEADPTSSGFNGDVLIQNPPPPAGPQAGRGMTAMPPGAPGTPPAGAPPVPPPGAPAGPPPDARGGRPPAGAPAAMPGGRGPAPDPQRARLMTVKQDYTRLALGLFAASSASPLTFSYAAVAEAPQGKADVLDAKGEGNFALRFFINSETHLPIMVSWNMPPTNVVVAVPGQPSPRSIAPGAVVVTGPPAPAANAPKEETDKYAKEVFALRAKAQATSVEHRLYFADYRDVDGVRFPFRLRRAIGSETTEETTFDRYRLNARIDPGKFEPLK